MGFMDLLGKAVDSLSKLNDGSFEENLMNKAMESQVYQGEHPGKFCMETCVPGDKCTECMEIQAQIDKQIRDVEMMEEYLDSPPETVMSLTNRPSAECSLCGAPIERGLTACPYCDTKYPEISIGLDIPASKIDRKAALEALAEDTWKKKIYVMNLGIESLKTKKDKGFLGNIMTSLSEAGMKKLDQNGADILKAAAYYNISVAEYLNEAPKSYNTYPNILAEQQDKQRQEYQEQMRQINEEERKKQKELRDKYQQQQKELYDEQRKRREHDHEFQMELLKSKERAADRASMDNLKESLDDFTRRFG
ncbi:MAG: hypothetical protein K6G45_03235 [Lachnospiraceae bacterium]|nr:hypothetical protein [Lachnospiraceae bacterium]